jgi:mono/diheme cytochrome c family protein
VIGRKTIFLAIGLWGSFAPGGLIGAEPGQDPATARAGLALFERKVRPVLMESCYSCHGAEKQEGGLRLDSREALLKGGAKGSVLTPGDPGKSRFIQVLSETDPQRLMPPKEALSRTAIADLERWVRMGAPDPRTQQAAQSDVKTATTNHWAFQPIRTPPVPAVQMTAWPRNNIDKFVLADLEKRQLQPPGPEDRAALIRRASFDLVGLPPTPEEIDAFLSDKSADAFAKVVDRLLNSAHFGEQWGRSWLSIAGYADTAAYALGGPSENAWRYRDYVIDAFNRDKPYHLFVQEQLAGDLLESDDRAMTSERLIATGFLVVGNQVVPELNRKRLAQDIADDQVELTTRAFLGLTVACARCHDHKTDPVTMRDYYALVGIFTSTSTFTDSDQEGRPGAPRRLERSLATPEQLREFTEYEAHLTQLKDQLREAREVRTEFPGGVDSTRLTGVVVDNLAAETHGAWKESNYSTNFVDKNYLHDGNAEKGSKTARFVPDLSQDGAYEVLVSYTPRANRATNVPVTITCKDGVKKVLVDQTIAPTIDHVFASIGRFNFAAGTNGSVLISNEGTKGFVVVDAVRFVPAESEGAPARTPFDGPDPEAALLNYHQLEKEVLECQVKRPILPQAVAVEDGKVRDGHLQLHGDPNQPGEEVPRGFPSILGTPDSTAYAITGEGSGRLELALWITSSQNPLAARVAVNRIWQRLFGQGLVETPDDFGVGTPRPSASELLDYLARTFIDQGWSWKKLIRSMVLSSTYQMSAGSPARPAAPGQDQPWRRANRRLEPETIRDAVLAVTGELDPKVSGTWIPKDVGTPDTQVAQRVQLSSRRRSVYLPVIRNFVPESLRMFDQPTPADSATGTSAGTSTGRGARPFKERFLQERSRAWSEALLRAQVPNEVERIRRAYRQALGRFPTAMEISQAQELLAKAGGEAQQKSDGPRAAAPNWEALCQSLITSPEFGTIQ